MPGQQQQPQHHQPIHPQHPCGVHHPQYQGAVNTGSLESTPSPLHLHLQHQSKSFPPRLTRTPSISSQSSLDSAPSRTSVSVSLWIIPIFHSTRSSCLTFTRLPAGNPSNDAISIHSLLTIPNSHSCRDIVDLRHKSVHSLQTDDLRFQVNM